MNPRPSILVCTRDENFLRRISAAILEVAHARPAETSAEAEQQITLHAPAAIVVDVRCEDIYQYIDEWVARHRDIPFIAAGKARTDRMLALNHVDLFTAADLDDSYETWREVLKTALKHHRALTEIQSERSRPAPVIPAAVFEPAPRPPAREGPSMITRISSAFRHFDQMDLMLDRAVEELATAAHTTRAGLFTRDESAGSFRLRTGLRYLKETASAVYEPRDPLVLWLERNAHMITRALVSQMPDPTQRHLLTRGLDLAGAEVLVPLQARGQLMGWLFVGHQSTGQPYTLGDLQDLSMAADYLSMLLENALLYREVALQKSLAETLLHSLPTGIVAVDGAGVIRWFSTSAEMMFNRKAGDVTGRPVESLGGRLADAVRRALQGQAPPPVSSWEDAESGRYLQVEAKRLGVAVDQLGAVAMIQDLTSIRHLQEKQAQLERTAFWNDLAAGLSHEIRNPLVAIRTFAQLLPERYQDEEFRQEFSSLVAREVDRLNGIIEQINGFANPVNPALHRVDVRESLRQALSRVFPGGAQGVKVKTKLEGDLPLVEGDEKALIECFAHLIRNAAEAISGQKDGSIECTAEAANGALNEPVVQITIHDNGHGIPQDVKDKVFSPFYTTKARGMGLGLPIAKRTVIDHNGRIQVESSGKGTSVVIDLPAANGHEPAGVKS